MLVLVNFFAPGSRSAFPTRIRIQVSQINEDPCGCGSGSIKLFLDRKDFVVNAVYSAVTRISVLPHKLTCKKLRKLGSNNAAAISFMYRCIVKNYICNECCGSGNFFISRIWILFHPRSGIFFLPGSGFCSIPDPKPK